MLLALISHDADAAASKCKDQENKVEADFCREQ